MGVEVVAALRREHDVAVAVHHVRERVDPVLTALAPLGVQQEERAPLEVASDPAFVRAELLDHVGVPSHRVPPSGTFRCDTGLTTKHSRGGIGPCLWYGRTVPRGRYSDDEGRSSGANVIRASLDVSV